MRKISIALTLLVACSQFAQAQNCPTASFSVTDSICSGNSINLTNTSTGGTGNLAFNWDFCPGDLAFTPGYDTLGDYGNFANVNFGIDLAYDNGLWYGFAVSNGNQTVTRYEFGNDLKNIPTAFDLGSFNGFLSGELDIAIINDNNQWCAFISKFNGDIVRLDFGPSLTNNTPSSTILTLTAGLIIYPFNIKLIKDHDRYKILTANAGGFSVSVVDIGPVITNNTPSVTNLPNTFTDILGVTVARDCDHWYGFTVARNNTDVFKIDFGDSITASPLSVTNLGIQSTINPSFEIEVINDGGKWYGITLGYTLNRINFGSTLNVVSPPVDNLPISFNNSERNFVLKKTGSTWMGIVNSTADSYLKRIIFPNICSSNQETATTTNPNGISYSGSGFHSMTLEVTDTNGNFDSYTDSVFLKVAAQTSFVSSPACVGTVVDFTDMSVINGSTISSWLWDFGDSNSASTQNATHTYSTPGDYIVVLETTSSTGCSSTFTDTISVRELPVANFSFADTTCAEADVSFIDLSTSIQDPINVWNWGFGDSTSSFLSNPLHSFLNGGTYTISLTVTTTKGCSAVIVDSIFIKPRPVAGFDLSNTCIGQAVTFTNLTYISDGSALSYSWNFGDLSVSNATSPVHGYANAVAIYTVSLIASSPSGCADTTNAEIRIGNQPIPSFIINPVTVCKGNSVNFNDLSFVPGGGIGDTINSWQWNFGDTTGSLLQSPVHTYSDTGTYIVTLIVSSPTSCDSSVSKIVTVIDAPVAAFNYANVCEGLTNTFIDFSSAPPGSVITSRIWDFGDSTSASGTTVSHTYALPGTYIVTLTVVDTFGCSNFISNQVVVYPLPVASFTNSIACSGSSLAFTNTSSISNGDTIISYFWNFGDGNSSTAINPTHTYSSLGTKTIILVAVSSHGCMDTLYQLLYVNQSPNPGFTYSQTCKGEATQFNYLVNPFPSTIASYMWTFGDLGTSIDENPIHTYASALTYNVTVMVTDFTGCSASITSPVMVNPLPDAGFGYANGCVGIPTNFTDSSTLVTGNISSYFWQFGNGNTSILANPSFVFDSAAVYTVNLLVTSAAGCVDSVSKQVYIVDLPVASFTLSSLVGSPPLNVNLTNTSSNATNYFWDFGDGFTSNLENPSHVYTDTGSFTLTLFAFNQEGCSDSAVNSVFVLIPYVDLAVINVITKIQNGLIEIEADLFNLGNVVINNFDIIGSFEGGPVIHESYSKPLLPGILKYTFGAKLETNEFANPAYLCVEVRNPNGTVDKVPENDKKCTSTSGAFEIINTYNDPVSEQASINFNLPDKDMVLMEIHDITGKKMLDEIIIAGTKGFNTYTFDARNLSKGIYFCFMKYREESQVKRILKY